VKLVVWEPASGGAPSIGLLTKRGVVSLADLVPAATTPQLAMQSVIDQFPAVRRQLEDMVTQVEALPLDSVRLLAPLPRPGKILCSTATYGPGQAERTPLLMTLKSAESVIGPGATIELPDVSPDWQFLPEVELGLVIRGPAKGLSAQDWRSAVFGYTCVVDVMPRGDTTFGRDYWLAKADTLGPLGPCIVTADEIADPNALRVQSFDNGQPRQDYSTSSAHYSVPEQVEFATAVMTLHTGDVVACGTSPAGLQPLRDGDVVEAEIERVGKLSLHVRALVRSTG
jgi:2-keto-4-pentenoate hydratase/2-oxohepta-3-ene-1,7-dioic acid hydratase in catechol pathway